jgi:hypothetical protein
MNLTTGIKKAFITCHKIITPQSFFQPGIAYLPGVASHCYHLPRTGRKKVAPRL